MKLSILAGSTSQTVNVFIQDSSSTTGAGLTGLAFNTSSLVAYYALSRAAAAAITLATLAVVTSAWSSGGFKEIDATNMPGWYRFDIPDAALASGRFVSIHFKGATNMAPLPIEIELTAWNNQDGAAGGLSRISGDAFARLGAPAGASVSADIAAVKSDTGTILTDVNTGAGAIYTRIGAPAGASIAADIAAVKAVDDAVKVKTDNLPASPAAVGSAMTLTSGERTSVADALLNRDMSAVTVTNARSPINALRPLRNKVSVPLGIVYAEDDTTTAWAFTTTVDAAQSPITVIDPTT